MIDTSPFKIWVSRGTLHITCAVGELFAFIMPAKKRKIKELPEAEKREEQS